MPHEHDHSPGHPQAPINYRKAFAIGIALNVSYVAVEAVFGLFAHSLALVADAGHNLSDVLSLLLAWGASEFGQSKPSKRFTYALRSSSILASLANAIILLIAIGAIAWEAFQRFSQPQEVPAVTVMVVAGFGVLINAATALLFMSGRHRDLNIKGAFLHMAADAGVSLGVVLAGLAIKLTGQYWIDPAMSLVIVAVIAIGTWGLLRESIRLALQAVPEGVDLERVETLSRVASGRHRGARSSYLANEHDANRAHRASRNAEWQWRRRVLAQRLPTSTRRIPNRTQHDSNRTKCESMFFSPGTHGLNNVRRIVWSA